MQLYVNNVCISVVYMYTDAGMNMYDTCFLIPNFPLSSVDVDSDWCNTSLYTCKKHECEFVSLNTLAQRLRYIVRAHNYYYMYMYITTWYFRVNLLLF